MNPTNSTSSSNASSFISHPDINRIYNDMIYLTLSQISEVGAAKKHTPTSQQLRQPPKKQERQEPSILRSHRRRSIDCGDLSLHMTIPNEGTLWRKDNSWHHHERIDEILNRDASNYSKLPLKLPRKKLPPPEPSSADELLHEMRKEQNDEKRGESSSESESRPASKIGNNHFDNINGSKGCGTKIPSHMMNNNDKGNKAITTPKIRLRRHSVEASLSPFKTFQLQQSKQGQQPWQLHGDNHNIPKSPEQEAPKFVTKCNSSSTISNVSTETARHKVVAKAMIMQANKIDPRRRPYHHLQRHSIETVPTRKSNPPNFPRRAPKQAELFAVPSNILLPRSSIEPNSATSLCKTPPPMEAKCRHRTSRRHSMSDGVPPSAAASFPRLPPSDIDEVVRKTTKKKGQHKLGPSSDGVPMEDTRNKVLSYGQQVHRRPKFIAPRITPSTLDGNAAEKKGAKARRRHSMSDCIPPSFPRLPLNLDEEGMKDATAKNRLGSHRLGPSRDVPKAKDTRNKNTTRVGHPRYVSPGQSSPLVKKHHQHKQQGIPNNSDADYSKWDRAMERFRRERDGNQQQKPEKQQDAKNRLPSREREPMGVTNIPIHKSGLPPRRCSTGNSVGQVSMGSTRANAFEKKSNEERKVYHLDESNVTKSTKTPTASSESVTSIAASSLRDVQHKKPHVGYYVRTNSSLDDSMSSLENSMRSSKNEHLMKVYTVDIGRDYDGGMSLGSFENSMHSEAREDKVHGHSMKEVNMVVRGGTSCSPTTSSPTGVADFVNESTVNQNMDQSIISSRRASYHCSGGDIRVPPLPGTVEEKSFPSNIHRTNIIDHDLTAEGKFYERLKVRSVKHENAERGGGLCKRTRRFSDYGISHSRPNGSVNSNSIKEDSWKSMYNDLMARRDSAEGRNDVSRETDDKIDDVASDGENEVVAHRHSENNSSLKQMLQEHEEFLSSVQERYSNVGQEKVKAMAKKESRDSIGLTPPTAQAAPHDRSSSINNSSHTVQECNGTEEDEDHYATMLKKIWYQPKLRRRSMMG